MEFLIVYLAAGVSDRCGIGLLLALSVLLPGVIWADLLVTDSELREQFCYDVKSLAPCLRLSFGGSACHSEFFYSFLILLFVREVSSIGIGSLH